MERRSRSVWALAVRMRSIASAATAFPALTASAATPACSEITDIVWPTVSCRSREMRSRSRCTRHSASRSSCTAVSRVISACCAARMRRVWKL
jgi:hypothetical protein